MTVEHPGYNRPNQHAAIDESHAKLISKTCPGANIASWTPAQANQDMFWGPWLECYTGHSTNDSIRHTASSGGALSALLIHALETKIVDQVVHIAADNEHPTRNKIHYSYTREEVLANAGSRYAASSPLIEIENILQSPFKTAFVGKPCDISALKEFSLRDPRVAERIPLTFSFFCGSLPSHEGADQIIRSMGLTPQDVIEFRYRGNGWPGKTIAKTNDGAIGEMLYADSWGGHLSKTVQFRCKICPDAVGGVADIACADAWYGDTKGYPSFEEQDGRSLILTRSKAGAELLSKAVAQRDIADSPLNIREIDKM